MKFISFNPWRNVMMKSIIDDNEPFVAEYTKVLNENADYYIGVTEPEELDHTFEELVVVLKDSCSFDMVPELIKQLDNEELVNLFLELY